MCFSAIHWARLDTIVYGTRQKDVLKRGFNELHIPNSRMKAIGKSKVTLLPGFLREECEELLMDWDMLPNKIVY